jgi:uncharacterized protein
MQIRTHFQASWFCDSPVMNTKQPSLSKRRSRRLRKKLHIAEFREEGFEISFRFRSGLSAEHELEILTKFISEVIEARFLLFGGGGESGFVTRAGRGSTTDSDREAIGSWLRSCASIEHVVVGNNQDAWYGCAAGDA